ncbi:MAG TPA: hypothetical protein VFI03_09890 [Solirubrobacterales bacterium]|nr:hypothetical protein [Solirubrobacterales bacterium]
MRTARVLRIATVSIVGLLASTGTAQAEAPANDAFASATPLTSGPFSVAGHNHEATKEAGEPSHAGGIGGHSVWYSWTPSTSARVGIGTGGCFSGIDTLVGVYTGAAVDDLTPVASNESLVLWGCPFTDVTQAEFDAIAGNTYWVAVDGKDGAQGSFELHLNPPPANDDFLAAQTIAAELPQSTFGSTRVAGRESGEPDHAGDPGGHSVWFSWTAASSGPVDIATCSPFSNLDSVLAVYTGASVDALNHVTANDDGASPGLFPECSMNDSEVRLDAVAGTTYRIAIDGASGTVGRYNLRLRGRPQNDDFGNAATLNPSLPTSVNQATNRFATKQPGEPDHANRTGGGSVWYSWTPASSGPVAIATCAQGDINPLLAVYTGVELDGLSLVAANDDGSRTICHGGDSEVRLSVTAGTTYWIVVDGRDGSQGRFNLTLEAPPPNDAFANPKALPGDLPVSDFGSTIFASKQGGEPYHAGNEGGRSVWFTWIPSESGQVVISVCPYSEGGPNTLLGVYTGAAVGSLTQVTSNDDSSAACQGIGSEVKLNAVAGTTYRIAVDAKNYGEGYFSIELSGRPDNDDFTSAFELPAYPMTAGGSTTFAGKQSGEPSHAGDSGGHSVWFSWTAPANGPMGITACGRGGVNTLLAVYTGAAVNTLSSVASNDDVAAKPPNGLCESPRDSEVVFDAVAGTTYLIAVDTKNGEGRFSLGFQPAPANDDFAEPTVLSGPLPLFGSPLTKLASKQSGEPDHAGDPGGHSVWFSWTPASSGPVTLSSCTYYGDLDALLAVYTGATLGTLTPVANGDDGASQKGCRSTDGETGFTAVAGTTYRIAVDGKAGSSGGVQLIVDGAARNDDFGKAQSFGAGFPVQWFSSNRFTSKQSGEPDHAGDAGGTSVWFKWTAPRSGEVSVDTCDSSFDTLLAVYTGAALGGLTPVGSNDDGSGKCAPQSKLTFEAVENAVYRIAVDGKGGSQGPIWMHLNGRPENDQLDTPAFLPSSSGWWGSGSTLLATKQSGEPDHAGDPGGHSVWFAWSPARSETVELDVCARTFAPVVAIYAGFDFGNFTPVETADAGTGECDEGKSVRFLALSTTTYRIAIDGVGGDAGHFELHSRPLASALRTLTVARAGGGSGSVSSNPVGISCGATCSDDLEAGTTVTLVAAPAAGSVFSGWSGGSCTGTGACHLTLNADTVVTAGFDLLPGSEDRGGGGNGGGNGSAVVPSPPPTPRPPSPKPVKCKSGFKKVRVKGKLKCVKRKPAGRGRGKSKGRGSGH